MTTLRIETPRVFLPLLSPEPRFFGARGCLGRANVRKDCMPRGRKPYDVTGQKFGRLTARARVDGRWVCDCDCGGKTSLAVKALVSGKTKSCGCLFSEMLRARNTVHGLAKSPAYRSWKDMRSRCRNPNDSDFKDYGGRGVSFDPSWDSFAAFHADMGDRPEGRTLDRIDVNGDYAPGNCRWATHAEQANNKRNNHLVEHEGQTKTLSEWCKEIGLDPSKVRYRLKQGWPTERAFLDQDFRK